LIVTPTRREHAPLPAAYEMICLALMDSLLSGLWRNGYSILFAVAFLEAIGLPVPAALALIIAGAAAARGSLFLSIAAACAVSAMVLGDLLLFLMGRYTGWWLLGLLCRLSLNPESCVLRSADSFYRRGRVLLVFAKFVPGINTMAPPLAGSMNMRLSQFLALDFAGTVLYVGVWLAAGYVFSGAIGALIAGFHAAGHLVSWTLIAIVVSYLLYQAWAFRKARRLPPVPLVSPSDAAHAMSSEAAVIYDVRSHSYYDRDAMRVRGSRRLDPHGMHRWEDGIPADRTVFLYCTCVRQATSAHVARLLLEKGVPAAVIEGGLDAWKKVGLPIEPVPVEEIAALPVFD
jgi:membrane protein DedA with SNARE-associated domain/rhodanese-related sulfurtransferase